MLLFALDESSVASRLHANLQEDSLYASDAWRAIDTSKSESAELFAGEPWLADVLAARVEQSAFIGAARVAGGVAAAAQEDVGGDEAGDAIGADGEARGAAGGEQLVSFVFRSRKRRREAADESVPDEVQGV